jgi:hypothetical protein
MPDAVVNIEIYCERCGAGICSNATFTIHRGLPTFMIAPCDKCMRDAEDEGYDKGYDDAKAEYDETG